MNKKKLLALIAKKEARKQELGTRAAATEDVNELRSINTELDSLNSEIAELRSMTDVMALDDVPMCQECGKGCTEPCAAMDALVKRSAAGPEGPESGEQRSKPTGQLNVLGTYGVGQPQTPGVDENKRTADLETKFEQRGQALKEKRAVTFDLDELPELRATTVGGGTLVTQKKYSNTVNQKFNEVSRVIDVVNTIPLMGGESYEQAFEVTDGEGGYTTETGDYTDADPAYDYVSITKAKITAYAEISDEATKLPNIDYQSRVKDSIVKAIRKKISKQILVGPGGANALTGIFNAPAKVIPTTTDLLISEIDADTLDKIVINYGGDEEVEGMGYLVLNKKDLAAFAAVRDADGRKLYKIKTNGNTGTISSQDSFEVPFIINSIVPALSNAATPVDTYCMAYGMMQAYELPIFSALTVEESRDFKFKSGQVAYRGSVWAGGNVAMYKGFIRVKKVAAV